MDGFTGRDEELQRLENIYSQRSGSCAVSGRRHMGKTSLVSRFCEGKKHIYIAGTKGVPYDNLRMVARELSRFAGRPVEFPDMIELFPTITTLCSKQKVVVVIDHYADLVDNFPELASTLREFLARQLSNTQIMLVVCDEDSSVFDRFFNNIEVKTMNYRDCASLHPEYTPRQNLMVYSMVGGVPAYHSQFTEDPTNIMRTRMFDHMSFFHLESECFFADDSNGRQQFKVMSALASGAYNVRTVSDRAGINSTTCSKILEDMCNRDLLIKENSGNRLRGHNFFISSYLLKFYFEVVSKYTHIAEYYGPEKAYEEASDAIMRYLDDTFREVCMEYVRSTYEVKDMAHVRGRDSTDVPKANFTSVMYENDVRRSLFSVCRLTGKPLGVEDLQNLKDFAADNNGVNRLYFLFSGCGFDDDLRAEARNPNVKLITLDDLYA